mmetsp:Transcript_853/g.1034  ORF Transcript_853/g.1034 Transcript_853/m.1034 type:complete len:205 (+) Transcript_853:4122-4736(+)
MIIAVASNMARRLDAHSPRVEAVAYPSSAAVDISLATVLLDSSDDAKSVLQAANAHITKLADSLSCDDAESREVLIELIEVEVKAAAKVSHIPSSSNETRAKSTCCFNSPQSALLSMDVPIALILLSQKESVIVIAANMSIPALLKFMDLIPIPWLLSLTKCVKALRMPSLDANCIAALRYVPRPSSCPTLKGDELGVTDKKRW